jgi:hypothetical protein
MNILEKSLFETGAIKVADENAPFWYTSGTIGPFFINTHYLYGGEDNANAMLKFIDANLEDREYFTKEIIERMNDFYDTDENFKKIMDLFYETIRNNENFKHCDFVSGGERRDWFFSPVISRLSGKEHIFIFKNLDTYTMEGKISDLKGSRVAHIADLINQASSYERAWIPAIGNINGKLSFSASVVDRSQGGKEFLTGKGIICMSPVIVSDEFFNTAKENEVINAVQLSLIKEFVANPDEYGIKFLKGHPEFLKSSLSSADKSVRSKAERCINENPYKMDFTKFGLN